MGIMFKFDSIMNLTRDVFVVVQYTIESTISYDLGPRCI